jgi:hypothetical protein
MFVNAGYNYALLKGCANPTTDELLLNLKGAPTSCPAAVIFGS